MFTEIGFCNAGKWWAFPYNGVKTEAWSPQWREKNINNNNYYNNRKGNKKKVVGIFNWGFKMSQWLMALVTKPEALSLSFGAHMVRDKLPQIIIWPSHAITHTSTHEDMSAHTQVHKINKCD